MKKIVGSLILLLIFGIATLVYAQGYGQDWNYCPYCGQSFGEGGYGMGSGMMWGRHGMMGSYGMGPGKMWGGHGRGYDYYQQSEKCQKFYDQTAKLRKELNEKRFDYFEAMRNPKTTGKTLTKLKEEIRDTEEKIYSKAPRGCWLR
jgi:hypothetical protein